VRDLTKELRREQLGEEREPVGDRWRVF